MSHCNTKVSPASDPKTTGRHYGRAKMTRTFALISLVCTVALPAAGQLPPGFEDSSLITGIAGPIAMTYAPDGRLFICERGGRVLIYKQGQLLTAPFAQLSVSASAERGLLGIAVDPNFATQPYVYVYYTTNASSLNPPSSPKNRVSRLTAAGDAAVAGSEVILVDNIPSDLGFHNAGCIRFGLDGKLYIATGDGGSFASNSQDLTTLAGKILRVNPDGTVPPDNPFLSTSGARGEIYCLGLRNPFRFSFRPGTNTMYIADVGQSTWEEVNVGEAGANYGWPTHEGPTTAAGFTTPMFAYNHDGSGASITGGCFINNPTWPAEYQGSYYYGDFVDRYIARLVVSPQNTLVQALSFGPASPPVDFIQGLDGDLYYANVGGGSIQRVWYSGRTAGYSISTSETVVEAGRRFMVNWAAPAGRPAADWVGIFKLGDPNSSYARYWYTFTNGVANGSFPAALAEPGIYEVRYFLDNGFTVAGRSPHIRVTAAASPYSLTPSATTVTAGAPLAVSWTAPSGSAVTDWIGLYRVGDSNRSYGWWRYTNGDASGTFDLTAPAEPGQYEFRYLLENGYTDTARSSSITVEQPSSYSLSASPASVAPGGSVTVSWTAPAGSAPDDWIGLFRVGASHREYISWIYTGGATAGSAAFRMPAQTGEYEFRYLLNDGYTDLRATSNKVTVQ